MVMGDPSFDNNAEQTTSAAGGVVEQVQQAAGHVVEQVVEGTKHAAGQAAGAAREQALRQGISALMGQKDDAAAILSAVAEGLQLTGTRLRAQDKADVARSAGQAAAQLDRLALYLRGHSRDELAKDVERIAGNVPAVLISGAFVAGLLGGRLLQNTEQQDAR